VAILATPGDDFGDRYEVERELKPGGMAHVYVARDLRYGRRVAIKVLRPELADAMGGDRFLREIEVVARLQHPHILPLFDSGVAHGLPFYVMPLVEGETLRERLRREVQLPVPDTLRIVTQVADALDYAHSLGVIHRDIKPENILLSGDRAFVVDFGVARLAEAAAGEWRSATDTTMWRTETGLVVGTVGYMSPEQATGAPQLDGRSDQYSLASLVYEMLAGETPFQGASLQVWVSKILTLPPPSVRITRETVPGLMDAALQRALSRTPADRCRTCGEFVRALERRATRWDRLIDLTKTRSFKRALGVTAAGVALVTFVVYPQLRPTSPLADHRVLVFPLVTTDGGPDAAALGWEAALAIEQALERTEPLKWLDGWQLLGDDQRDDPRLLTQAAAVGIARTERARYYVTGVIRGTPDAPSVTLWLNDAAGDSVIAPETRAGVGASAPLLAMRAMERLLGLLVEPGRPVDLSALTQRAQGAIALTLQGDRAYRQARFLEALDFYKRAVAADSLSAMTAVKGAWAASWAALTEAEAWPLLNVALRADSLLPARHHAFVLGLRAYFAGQPDSAIVHLRAALRGDPEWAEAWMSLGEVYYHLLPRATSLDSLAEDAFRRASRADSLFAPPLVHLTESSARRGDLEATRRLVARFHRIGADSTYARELRFLLGCLERGPDALRDAKLGDSVGVTLAARHLAAGGHQLACAEAGFRSMLAAPGLSAGHRAGLVLGMQGVLMAGGRYRELADLLDSSIADGNRGAYAHYLYDDVLGAPVDRGSADAERLARELTGELYERSSPTNRWLLGLWHIRRGNTERAAAIAAGLARGADSTGGRLDRLLADALAAHVTLALGDTATALEHFGRLHADFPDRQLAWYPAYTIAPTRLLHAEVLLARHRPLEADSVVAVLDQATIVSSLAALPRVLQIRAAAAEAGGRSPAAREYRRRLERLRTSG
jgi:tRNA A-37 threonylcarbamoyl transferase component Bud32/tetratricopeptide (TPR) repeat protein